MYRYHVILMFIQTLLSFRGNITTEFHKKRSYHLEGRSYCVYDVLFSCRTEPATYIRFTLPVFTYLTLQYLVDAVAAYRR